MINFIVCDDDSCIAEIVKKVITKTMFPTSLEYKIHIFNKYDKDFYAMMQKDISNKIYVLDIEVGNKSGLEVAKEIRDIDWDSTILILTAHYELEILAYKSKILLFDFISKFDLYDEKICNSINQCVDKVLKNNKLIININKTIHHIEYNNILYLTYDTYKRKTIICTLNKTYEVNASLKEIYSKLKGNFIYTHRACIVNVSNIDHIDIKNKVIYFKNNTNTYLVSRSYIKELKQYECN